MAYGKSSQGVCALVTVALTVSLLTEVSGAKIRGPKLKLLDPTLCDRLSLEALYYEEYWPQTQAALEGQSQLVVEVADRMLADLQAVYVKVQPMSTKNDEEAFRSFTEAKKKFSRKVDKIKRNITQSWDNLVTANKDFLSSKENVTPRMVIKRAEEVDVAYKKARIELDRQVEDFVKPLKGMVLNGLTGLEAAVDSAIKKDLRKSNKSSATSGGQKGSKASPEQKELSKEERLRELIDDLLPKFLGNLTKKILDRGGQDTFRKPSEKSADDRDSVLDDISYTIALMKGKIKVLLSGENLRSEEKVDLARRNLYLMWAGSAETMYRKRKEKSRRDKKVHPRLWTKEEDIADILVTLMETYT